MTETIVIHTEWIKLQDLLKYASAVSTGGEAKLAIAEGKVSLNGQVCTQRGKKLRGGDVVSYAGRELTVAHAH